jgi:hypothetical protein
MPEYIRIGRTELQGSPATGCRTPHSMHTISLMAYRSNLWSHTSS